MRLLASRNPRIPAIGQSVQYENQRGGAAADQHEELHEVCPDDSCDTAHGGPQNGKHRDDDNAFSKAPSGHQLKHERRCIDANALTQDPTENKHAGSNTTDYRAEAIGHVLIGAVELFLVVQRNEEAGNEDPRDNAAKCKLQVNEIAIGRVHQRRNTDKGNGTDGGRNA